MSMNQQRQCYFDNRPKAKGDIFEAEVITADVIRLVNVDDGYTTITTSESFRKYYEPINW